MLERLSESDVFGLCCDWFCGSEAAECAFSKKIFRGLIWGLFGCSIGGAVRGKVWDSL